MSTKTSHRRSAEHQARVMDLRKSNATTKHKSVKDYQRKPKHTGRGYDQ